MRLSILLFIFVNIMFGCRSKVEVKGHFVNQNKDSTSDIKLLPQINAITMDQGRIKIEGENLDKIKSLRLRGENIDAPLVKSMNLTDGKSILVDAGSHIYLALNKMFSIIISDAYGAEKNYSVKFTITNGSITADMLSNMGAVDGEVLVYDLDKKKWVPKPLNGLNYKGLWNPEKHLAPAENPSSGDYFIVGKSGTFDLSGTTEWAKGDWAIYNGQEWQKIKNSNDVLSFNGRKGAVVPTTNDYNWEQIDKSQSQLSDIQDVDALNPANGQILKWMNGKWVLAEDLVGAIGSVGSNEISNNSITNDDIATNAGIAQSKISGLDTTLNSKQNALPTDNAATAYLKGDLTIGTLSTSIIPEGTNQYFTVQRAKNATVINSLIGDATDLAPSQKSVADALALKPDIVDIVTDDISEGSNNLFFTESRARLATIDNSITSNITNKAPSQKAVFDALALKGDFKSDGTIPLTGDLHIGANSIKIKDNDTANLLTIGVSNALSSNINFILPPNQGSNGQVLKTDGTGNLYWSNDNDSGVTANSVNSSSIANDSITNEDIASSASIDQNKISGLVSALNAKQNTLPTNGTNGQVLKVDAGGNFVWATDNTGGSNDSVSTDNIINGTIVNADISATAAIDQNKISGLSAALDAKQNSLPTNGTNGQVLKVDAGGNFVWGTDNTGGSNDSISTDNIINSTIVNADISATAAIEQSKIAGLSTTFNSKQDALPTNGTNGQVLKVDAGGNFVWGTDNTGVSNDSVTSTSIVDGTIVNSDISATAAIEQSKIANLTTDLGNKLSSNGTLTGLVQSTTTGNSFITGGHVGIGTNDPKATLDINGQVKLSVSSTEPVACDANKNGSLSLTAGYKTCVCRNGVGWVSTVDGRSPCDWAGTGTSVLTRPQWIFMTGANQATTSTSYVAKTFPTTNSSDNTLGYIEKTSDTVTTIKKAGTVRVTANISMRATSFTASPRYVTAFIYLNGAASPVGRGLVAYDMTQIGAGLLYQFKASVNDTIELRFVTSGDIGNVSGNMLIELISID